MSALGDKLRAAREQKGLSLKQVALETRIRTAIIQALEAGDHRALPPAPYTRGLLRTYSAYLGLEPELALDEYAIESDTEPPSTPPPRGEPKPQGVYPVPADTTPSAASPLALPLPSFTVPTPAAPAAVAEATPHTPEPPAALETAAPEPPAALETATPGLAPPAEPAFEIAPPEFLEKRAAPPEKPTWLQRLSATKLPEAVAGLAVLVILLGLVVLVYPRLSEADVVKRALSFLSPAATATPTPSPTVAGFPTPVPTFEITASPLATGTAELTPPTTPPPTPPTTPPPTSAAVVVTPTLNIPPDALMTLQLSTTAPVWTWVIADNVQVFKGVIENETKAWTAHERLYVQVKDIPNGVLLLNDRRLQPRVFAERKVMERAWMMSATGKPIAVPPEPFPATAAPSPTPTLAPTDTPTRTPPPPPAAAAPYPTLAPALATPNPTPTPTPTPF